MESKIREDYLKELLLKKMDTLEHIKKITAQAIRILEEENFEEFQRLLFLRREGMEESSKIDHEILQEVKGRENFAMVLKENREVAMIVSKIREILNKLKELDSELNQKARKILDEIKQKIEEHYRAKKAIMKYNGLHDGYSPQFGFFIDMKK